MVRKTERVGKNRHRKWRTESNGRTRAKRPSRLASIQHCSPARAGPTHAGTERKSVGSESWRKKQRRCPLKSSTAKFRGHLDPSLPLRGSHAEVGMTPRDSSGPLGPRIGRSEVTALLSLALRPVDPVARPPPPPFCSVRDACSTTCGCFAVSHWARSARALCHTATLRANLRFADDLRGNPTRKDDGRCSFKCWRARQRKTPNL